MITPRQLARAYDLAIAAHWRGDDAGESFFAWLGSYRTAEVLTAPQAAPEALSLLGGGGSGIRWYSTPTAVLGFAAGHPCVCYRIPSDTDFPTPNTASVRETIVPVELVTASL